MKPYRQEVTKYRSYLPIPEDQGYTAIGIGGCYRLLGYRITVPEGVEVIAPYAFAGCDNIEHIVLPSTLKTIDEGAFLDCASLRELVIPNGVETIGDLAFFGCGSRVYCQRSMPLTLPESVKAVGRDAFLGIPPRGDHPTRPAFFAEIRFCRGNIDQTFTITEIDPYLHKKALTQTPERPFVLLGFQENAAVIYSHDDEKTLILPLGETVHAETEHIVGAAYEYTDLTTTYRYVSDFTLTKLSFA